VITMVFPISLTMQIWLALLVIIGARVLLEIEFFNEDEDEEEKKEESK